MRLTLTTLLASALLGGAQTSASVGSNTPSGSPWEDSDSGLPASPASTNIESGAGVSLTGLPQTSDMQFGVAIDPVTGQLSTQALPSAAALGNSIENKLLVQQGNAGKTVSAITFTPKADSGLMPTISLPTDTGNANTVIVGLSDYGGVIVNGDYVGNIKRGEEHYLELYEGDYIQCTGGMSGCYMMSNNAWMPLLHTGFGGTEFSIWVFRSATSNDPAQIGILVGDQESEIVLLDASANELYRATHDALEIVKIPIDNGGGVNLAAEYRLTSSSDVAVAKLHSSLSIDPADCTVLFPAVAEPMIAHCKNGTITSYDAAGGGIELYVRDGVSASGIVTYGNNFQTNTYGTDSRLGANALGKIYPQNRVAWNSGADGDGSETVPATICSWMSNMIGIPLYQTGRQILSFGAEYETNIYFYDEDHTLIYTGRATRTNTSDQRHPAALTIETSSGVFSGSRPAYVIADAPIDLKINLLEPDRWLADPTTTTRGTEETIMHGISTPNFIRPRLNHATQEWEVWNTSTNAWDRG